MIYAGKYQSSDKRMVLLPYGDRLKRQRAAFHQMLQPRGRSFICVRDGHVLMRISFRVVMGAYEGIQELEALKLLDDLVAQPEQLRRHYERFSAGLVFTLTYGKRLGANDAVFTGLTSILENFVQNTYPGAHLVDTFPILDRLPDFVSPWRVEARRCHAEEIKVSLVPS